MEYFAVNKTKSRLLLQYTIIKKINYKIMKTFFADLVIYLKKYKILNYENILVKSTKHSLLQFQQKREILITLRAFIREILKFIYPK